MASHSPATILGVKTGTKWQLNGGWGGGERWTARAAPSPHVAFAPNPFRVIGRLKTVLITASVLIAEIAPRDVQEATR